MLGVIAGDMIGSIYEIARIKTKAFPLFNPRCHFTDDTVLTVAIAQAILDQLPYEQSVLDFGRRYPDAGYGKSFMRWLNATNPQPYTSWGNGSAMRVAPVAYAFDDVDSVLAEAAKSAMITHNHPEAIKGAQATALAIFLCRQGCDKPQLRREISTRFGYDLRPTVDEIRPAYKFDVSCQGTLPAALIAFLDATSYEDTVRNAVSLGGDSDTLAAIAGGFAEAHYGAIPAAIGEEVVSRLTDELWQITQRFAARYGLPLFSTRNSPSTKP